MDLELTVHFGPHVVVSKRDHHRVGIGLTTIFTFLCLSRLALDVPVLLGACTAVMMAILRLRSDFLLIVSVFDLSGWTMVLVICPQLLQVEPLVEHLKTCR